MSILIKKNSGSYHLVNNALYEALMSKDILIENGDVINTKSTLMEVDTSFNELIKGLLKQNNYRIDTLKEKEQQPIIDTILELIGDDFSTTNIKNAVQTFIDNEENKKSTNVQQKQNNTDAQQNNNQSNTQSVNNEPKDDANNKTDTQKEETTNPELEKYNNLKDKEFINIMKEYNYLDDIIQLANKGEGQQYTAETIPQHILYKYAENYKPYRNRLLTIRFINQLKNINIPDNIKDDLINLYKQNERTSGSIRNILSSPKLKEKFEHKYQSAYDFPIADYYIEKYNKQKSYQILNRMADEVINYVDSSTGYKAKLKRANSNEYINLKNFVDNTEKKIDYNNTDKKELKKQIYNLLKQDIKGDKIVDVVNNYNVLNNTNIDPYDENVKIFEIYNSDSLVMINLKDEVIGRIKSLLKMLGMIPVIDYMVVSQPFTLTDIIEDNNSEIPQKPVARIQLFSNYSISKIIGQVTNDEELKEKWQISVPIKKLSVVYDDFYNLDFKLKEEYYKEYHIKSSQTLSFKISFIKGFFWLEVIEQGFNKGKQKARQWKG